MKHRSLLLLLLCGCSVKAPEPIASINVAVNSHPYGNGYICKQYVQAKYNALVLAGIPPKDMTVVYGWTDNFEEHVELDVRYDGKDYVLDNRTNEVRSRPNIIRTVTWAADSAEWQYVMAGPYY